ncbi:iron(III) transport system permease protein [Geodermatophilus normandii]|uniref:Iron(III) transport system permease protein n=1 Tax=Geodermatophilus normandii TaxID=1137989 RepID=A0A317QKZ1_9ACTN|nr:iron ABC transporter permease [Geodermatophilus normandii]PWW23554.1 iron(III) transport system permease protein [Geodermatophilus normandii]
MTPAARGRRAPAARRSPVTVLLAVAVAALALLPLVHIAVAAVDVGWSGVAELVFRRRVADLLGNTLRLVAGAVAVCTVLGVGAAWLVERTALPGRRGWHVLLVAPLALPAFVSSSAWISLLPGLDTYGGALLVVSLAYAPFVYLPAVAAFRGLDPALEETARGLGLSSWAVFRRVQLPQLRVAVLGGALLVALHVLAEFGALAMLRYPTFTTAVYDQYRATFNGAAATMLAGVLVLLCLVLLLAEIRLRGARGYARTGAGAARQPRPVRLGVLTGPALLALATVVGLALLVPVGALVSWFATGTSARVDWAVLAATTGTTLALAAGAAAVTTALALPTGWLAVRRRGPLATLLERTTYLGSAVPAIVVALALVTVSIRLLPGLYQTVPVLLAAYAVLFLPRAIVTVRAAVEQSPPVHDDVAASLGVPAPARLWRVTLPLLAPGIGAGRRWCSWRWSPSSPPRCCSRRPAPRPWRRRSGRPAAPWSTAPPRPTPSSWSCSRHRPRCSSPATSDEV